MAKAPTPSTRIIDFAKDIEDFAGKVSIGLGARAETNCSIESMN